MNDVFILGAGFSEAIYGDMPTMAELSTEVMDPLSMLDRDGRAADNQSERLTDLLTHLVS